MNVLEPAFVNVDVVRDALPGRDGRARNDSRVTTASRLPALPPATPIAAPTIARHASARRKRVRPMIRSPSLFVPQ